MYESHVVSQGINFGRLLIAHQGELQPNSEHQFRPTDDCLSAYSFTISVADDATTGFPSQLKGFIEGRDIVLRFPKLKMLDPKSAHSQAYRAHERFVLSFSSVYDSTTRLEFTVSLTLDVNARVEHHYLQVKPDHLPAAYEPAIQGPWYHLAVWVSKHQIQMPSAMSGG